MRFAEWRDGPEGRQRLPEKVIFLIETVTQTLGADGEVSCYVVRGDQPDSRFQVLAATSAGLMALNVRVNLPQEGPRVSGRLVRWGRVQAGEVAIEGHGGHVQVSAQFEGAVLQGLDSAAREIAVWMTEVYRNLDRSAGG
jgi:hypothetical protein